MTYDHMWLDFYDPCMHAKLNRYNVDERMITERSMKGEYGFLELEEQIKSRYARYNLAALSQT